MEGLVKVGSGAARAAASAGSAGRDDDWWRTGVVYQVYPRSFADANGDGIGDLPGLIAHLDHLNDGTERSLGVDAVWLSPFYPSPGLDLGYDVSDYTGVDPVFGTLADVERLVGEAHRRGIKVIIDLVLNHSSDRHPWFVASRASLTGPYADWYIWADPAGRTAGGAPRRPNNWVSFFGGPAWTWDDTRGQFYLHTFLPEQPDLNWRNPATRTALLDVVRTWLDREVDGLRFDVFNAFFKDADLRSNPLRPGGSTAYERQHHLYDKNRPEMSPLLREIRAMVDERSGRMTVGELFEGTAAQAAGYYAPRHLVFDFTLVETPWSADGFRRAIAEREDSFGPDGWPTVVLSNHDRSRHASRFDEGRHGEARARVAAVFETTLRGTPFLYYGEEIGLRDVAIPRAEIVDPPAKRPDLDWWNRDQARAPMAWSPDPNGGFTTAARPWLRMSPDYPTRNVVAQAADPGSLFSLYRRLVWFRRTRPALHSGELDQVELGPSDILAYLRTSGDEAALVVLAFGDDERPIVLPPTPSGRPWRAALSTHEPPPEPGTDGAFVLRPVEGAIFVDDDRELPANRWTRATRLTRTGR
jgi:alpha-glucosidase